MFTGIVEERGRVGRLEPGSGGRRLVVLCKTVPDGTSRGDSIAVNGVCLTVVERAEDSLAFDLTPETLERSALASLAPGQAVNLERPLTLADRLGGHLVQGHVDGVGRVDRIERNGDGGARALIRIPPGLERYVVEKGSIALDGVSLTVSEVSDGRFWVALIPHTVSATTMGDRSEGDPVNIEVDVLAKYVEGVLKGR
jgi:riboflavin synthase